MLKQSLMKHLLINEIDMENMENISMKNVLKLLFWSVLISFEEKCFFSNRPEYVKFLLFFFLLEI